MKQVIKPGMEYIPERENVRIFLAGTIDNGSSEDWQKELTDAVKDDAPITFFNPRRDEWNPNEGEEGLIRQIRWEQYYLDKADVILLNFVGSSKSPISLLELGIYSQTNKLIVLCPKEYYRFMNVKLTCEKYNIPLVESDDWADQLNVLSQILELESPALLVKPEYLEDSVEEEDVEEEKNDESGKA